MPDTAGNASFVFFGVNAVASRTGVRPETFYHEPYAGASGAVLQLGMDGSWKFRGADERSKVLSGNGGRWQADLWNVVEIGSSVDAGNNVVVGASVNGEVLVRGITMNGIGSAGPAWLGTGFHQADFDNVSMRPTAAASAIIGKGTRDDATVVRD